MHSSRSCWFDICVPSSSCAWSSIERRSFVSAELARRRFSMTPYMMASSFSMARLKRFRCGVGRRFRNGKNSSMGSTTTASTSCRA